ncbi:ABC transporter ATP-binding protein [Caldimonas thermodepolymerans]|jgi:branched-chain amino acid transport system ATP-binding protein|uniref:ABC transporter ATP-binding protein n=1 Tax=Caldimonas thermodepolymerans TaxID=215580 RepID=UPI002236058C|nr:ABC transporter ATP-binding protein [Caldimonas thermodepolymerans]UZG44396.1 ABC transporter ATP-binding protein [Caldimonas thermodepolymerans]
MSKTLLKVEGIAKRYGGVQAVRNLSFDLHHGEILGLLGPNGAGKTTAFNMIAGFVRPDEGRITLNGQDITGRKPWDVCKAGIGRTFQLSKPFGGMSVRENLVVGSLVKTNDRARSQALADELLDFLGMSALANMDAEDLTAFERRKVELGRALSTEPTLLLMDEVVAGATPQEALAMVDLVKQVRDRGVTVLIIEHVMKVIMGLSDRVIVMHLGELIADGEPSQVVKQEQVLRAYFGEDYVDASA